MLSKLNQEKILAILEQKNFKIFNDLFIAYPENESDINKLFVLANKFKFKIMLMGTGSSISRQYSNLENTLYLSTRNLAAVLELDPANGFIRVESGIMLSELLRFVNESNLYIPLDCKEGDRSTLGGLISSLDPYSAFAYSIKGIEFILPTGETISYGGKIFKNVAGYDLTRLMIGSYGKFGIITSVLLNLSFSKNFFYDIESVQTLKVQEGDRENGHLYNNLKSSLDPEDMLW